MASTKCTIDNLYINPECNKLLLKKEVAERKEATNTTPDVKLYPTLNDPLFNVKIAQKKEFNDTQYDGTIHENIKAQADLLANADFELQPHQAFVKNYLSSNTPYNGMLLMHGVGTGKCHSKGTMIMLANGRTKAVEFIRPGDQLMGDDSTPRNVLSITQGHDTMYEVIPTIAHKGTPYGCNREHILCLRHATTMDNTITEIALCDYITDPHMQTLCGYRVAVDFPYKPVPIDPYSYGWSCCKTIESNIGIPDIYKFNSRQTRLLLFAGIVDFLCPRAIIPQTIDIELPQSNTAFITDFIYLVRSLGIVCQYNNHGSNNNVKITVYTEDTDLTTPIKIVKKTHGEYYGFTLDGNGRYLLEDFTVTHNTCSAIGVTEEVRDSMRELGLVKQIIIVASENVQENFKLQLFDERKLKFTDGQWTTTSCLGNKILREINPTNIKGLTRDKIANMIKNIVRTYYVFMGYGQFANYIYKTIVGIGKNFGTTTIAERRKATQNLVEKMENITITPAIIRSLRREFEGRMVVIDEVHNIRKSDEGDNKKVALFLELLVTYVRNMKLLFLSATPMFNSYKEIIWLLNILNMNDGRAKIRIADIYEADGKFKPGGEELLMQKATGYVSHVRGENPYTFPFRIYPEKFAPDHTFKVVRYPVYQMNGKRIPAENQKRILDLYLNFMTGCDGCGNCQSCCYRYVVEYLRNNMLSYLAQDFDDIDNFGYSVLQVPVESLIISYPIDGLQDALRQIETIAPAANAAAAAAAPKKRAVRVAKGGANDDTDDTDDMDDTDDTDNTEETDKDSTPVFEKSIAHPHFQIVPTTLVGKRGLDRMMDKVTVANQIQYTYKKETLEKYGRIFSHKLIGKYSVKIATILDYIQKSEGVIIIYSQYIEGGIIPMALALEEMGFVRYSEKSSGADNLLHRTSGADAPAPIDVRTFGTSAPPTPPTSTRSIMPARYAMITGNKRMSPDNVFDIKGLTGENNKDGHVVKVVLVSVAAAEGIDLKFIRQVHILNPWYNMNRIEQIVGRAVRNFSHKDLPFEKRNTEIFMHGTIIPDSMEEPADLYMYRIAEAKALPIGRTSRALKKGAVDCILNHEQTNFTQENIAAALKTPITQILASGKTLHDFKIGDAPFSVVCDYMDTCAYSCIPNKKINMAELDNDTYSENFIYLNTEKISQKIRMLMRESFFYRKNDLIRAIQTPRQYPLIQIYATLTNFIDDHSELITDKYGRSGTLQNIGDYYLFLPTELTDQYAPIFDRMRPVDFKHRTVQYNLPTISDIPANPAIPTANANANAAAAATATQLPPSAPKMPAPESTLYNNFRNFYNITAYEIDHGTITEVITTDPNNTVADETWYRICGKMMQKILADMQLANNTSPRITKARLLEYLVDHMFDCIAVYTEKFALLNHIWENTATAISKTSYEWYAKQYFERRIVPIRAHKGRILQTIMLYNFSLNRRLYVYLDAGTTQWREYTADDLIEYDVDAKMVQTATMTKAEYNPIVGFIGYIQKNDLLVFKIINLAAKRDMGYVCMQAGKKKIIDMLNDTLGGAEVFTKDNTKQVRGADGKITQMLLNPGDLCIIQEFMLRYFNDIRYKGSKWFIGPEVALSNEIYKLFTK